MLRTHTAPHYFVQLLVRAKTLVCKQFSRHVSIGSGGTSSASATKREREMWKAIDRIVEDVRGAEPLVHGEDVRTPGDGIVATRQENQIRGAPVDASLWAAVKAMH